MESKSSKKKIRVLDGVKGVNLNLFCSKNGTMLFEPFLFYSF